MANLVRVKVAAVFLQTDGLGIVSQITSLKLLFGRLIHFGVGPGLVKTVAESSGRAAQDEMGRLLSTVVTLYAGLGTLLLVLCVLFSAPLADAVLADRDLGLLIILTGVAVALTGQVQIIRGFLQGLLQIRQMVILSFAGAVAATGIAVPLMIWGGVTGAVVSISLAPVLPLVAGQVYLHKVVSERFGIRVAVGKIDWTLAKNLGRLGGATSAARLMQFATLLTIRSFLIHELGASANGLFHVAWSVSHQYLLLASGAIWTYCMPKITTLMHRPDEVKRTQNEALRLTMLVLVPMTTVVLLSREVWIPLLYSSAFLGAYTLITWQMAGNLLSAVNGAANLTNLPRERFGFILGQAVASSGIHLGSFMFLLPQIGILAAPASYSIAQALMTPAVLAYHRCREGFTFDRRNWWLLIRSGLVVGLAMWMARDPGRMGPQECVVTMVALLAWGATALTAGECRTLLRMLRRATWRSRNTR